MKLEFLDSISADGKFKDVVAEQLIRLYDFDKFQVDKFIQAIQQTIIEKKEALDLSDLAFIEPINCTLTLRLTDIATGITSINKVDFICDLTISEYDDMMNLLKPFCLENSAGYQWLYNIDTPIEFLFSPDGGW